MIRLLAPKKTDGTRPSVFFGANVYAGSFVATLICERTEWLSIWRVCYPDCVFTHQVYGEAVNLRTGSTFVDRRRSDHWPQKDRRRCAVYLFGANGRIRTGDLFITSEPHYLLCYISRVGLAPRDIIKE